MADGERNGPPPPPTPDANQASHDQGDVDVVRALERLFERQEISDNPEARLILTRVQTLTSYNGPIPPPDMLAEYNRAVPGAGDEIFRSWRQQQQHRHGIEEQRTSRDEARMDRSQRNTLIIALIGLALATVTALLDGNPWVAGVIAVVSVGGPNAATILSRLLPGPRN